MRMHELNYLGFIRHLRIDLTLEPIAEVTGDQRSFGFRKLRAMAKRVENKAKKICQHATKTLKNNCCPI